MLFSLKRLVFICLYTVVPGGFPDQTSDWMSHARWSSIALATEKEQAVGPIDGRDIIRAEVFQPSQGGVWLSPEMRTQFIYDELIYSWSAKLPKGEGFRLYLRCGFGNADPTSWIYAGFWGKVDLVEGRTNPVFEQGRLEMDQVLLNRKAVSYQFKVVDEGDKPLSVLPSLHVVYTNNSPSRTLWRRFGGSRVASSVGSIILDLPFRQQFDPQGRWKGRCQSAALAAAMEYFGKPVGLEEIIPYTFDPEYNYPGIWPRTIATGTEFGFDAYIDRFRDWEQVRATVAENKVILCSILMPKGGDYIDPPYPSLGCHIVALNGVTDDGRVVVTDSGLRRDRRGFRCQWLREDFEKVWMDTKGGVGMVICPPAKADRRVVTDLSPFPGYRNRQP